MEKEELSRWQSQWGEVFDSIVSGERPLFEFDWFGIDSEDRVAVFSSGGHQLIREQVFDDRASYLEVATFVLLRPPQYETPPWDEDQFAAKGLYWYDLPERGESRLSIYSRRGVPRRPMTLHEFPTEAKKYLDKIRFVLRFADAEQICVTDHGSCG